MNAEHRRRIKVNEVSFRGYDEADTGIAQVIGGADSDADGYGPNAYACECEDACGVVLSLTPSQYEHVRSDLAWFAFGPDHSLTSAERVVEQHASHWIIAGAA